MTTDLKRVCDLIRNLSISEKRQAFSMILAEMPSEWEPDLIVPVTRGGEHFNYRLFRIPGGKVEMLDLKPGDALYERYLLATDPKNCSPLDEIPED